MKTNGGHGAGCAGFAESLSPYLDGELVPEARERMDSHARDCSACRRTLEAERHLLGMLRAGLRRAPAPPALRSALLRRLDGEKPRRTLPEILRRWAPPAAVTVSLLAAALLMTPALRERLAGERRPADQKPGAPHAGVIVDIECDRAGLTAAQQRACREPSHHNGLRTGEGRYLPFVDEGAGQALARDAALRGRAATVFGAVREGVPGPRLEVLRIEWLPGGEADGLL